MSRKQTLLSEVIRELEVRAAKLTDAARVTHEEAVRAPTPMESHSDRTRFEMQTASARQNEMAAKYGTAVNALKKFVLPKIAARVELGSLVVVERSGMKSRYFILPEGNGITVRSGNEIYTVVTPTSPLGKALLGKGVGEEFTFGGTPKIFKGKVETIG